MLVSTNTFLRRVSDRTGLDPERCGTLVELTITALASQLDEGARGPLTDNLPPTLAGWAESAPRATTRTLDELTAAGQRPEHVAVVCGAIAELLPMDVLVSLRLMLRRELAMLLVPRERAPPDLSAWREPR